MPNDHASSREPSPIGVGGQEIAARRVRVLLPLPLAEALDYLAPELPPPEPGSFVHVPLGQRTLAGVVWDGVGDELPEERLKPVIETLPTPRLRPELRRFVERVAAYTMAPPGSVLRMT
ncbi:MAG TPA: primosomal protein N', partial [Stellaceae bacterium]